MPANDYTYEAYQAGSAAYWSSEPCPRWYSVYERLAWLDGYADAKRDCPQLAEVCAGLPDVETMAELLNARVS